MSFHGFPEKLRYTPVPAPLLGSLLGQIDDLAEMKVILRAVWLLHQKRTYPRYCLLADFLNDLTLVAALGGPSLAEVNIRRSLDRAVKRGTLASATIHGTIAFTLNVDRDARALHQMSDDKQADYPPEKDPSAWDGSTDQPNIFAMYEDNIGMLNPMIAEELKIAESSYPPTWIEESFRIAVVQNKRSWRYIANILDRWEREGKTDAGPLQSPTQTSYY